MTVELNITVGVGYIECSTNGIDECAIVFNEYSSLSGIVFNVSIVDEYNVIEVLIISRAIN